MPTVAVAVSGGADSLFALVSLRQQGHQVLALHGLFLPESSPSSADAVPELTRVCQSLGIELHVLDLRKTFDDAVMAPFVRAYAAGRTPNPCALCNAAIKFGTLWDAAQRFGADTLATGHYAALRHAPHYLPAHEYLLAKGADPAKDQSYFLALVPQKRLNRVLFPLSNTTKTANVAALHEAHIPIPLPRESQEICFVPADAYRPFLQKEAVTRKLTLPGPGPMLVMSEGQPPIKVGEHQGLWQYTEGQRRGLGIAFSEPLYVCGKDHGRNALLLGGKSSLALRSCVLREVNELVPRERWPKGILARLRYRQQESPVQALWGEDARGEFLQLTFATVQSPTAPGQVGVVYDAEGFVLAGGTIDEVA